MTDLVNRAQLNGEYTDDDLVELFRASLNRQRENEKWFAETGGNPYVWVGPSNVTIARALNDSDTFYWDAKAERWVCITSDRNSGGGMATATILRRDAR